MLRKKILYITNLIFNSKQNTIFFIIPFFYFININYLLKGGLIYDDFSLSINHIDYTIIEKIKINCLLYFNTRPLGGIYAALISEFKANYFAYIFLNTSIWLITGITIYISIYNHFNKKSSLFFLIIFLFPSFASTPFFSPVTQSLGVFSIFLWSISIYHSSKKNIFLSLLFFILSLLTYEYTVVLFLINIILYLNSTNKKLKKNFTSIKKNFAMLFGIFSLSIIFIILLQFLIAEFTNNTDPIKYAIKIVNNKLVFEDNFFNNILKYSTKPFELIIIEIPKFFIRSLLFIKINFHNLLIYIIFIVILFYLSSYKKIKSKKNIIFLKTFFIAILFCTLFVFLMYLIVSSVPTIKGYYNRGLVGLFVCFAFFICLLSELKLSSIFFEKIKFFVISAIIFLNFNSFLVQKNNFAKTENVRLDILNQTKKFSDTREKESYLLMIVPSYLKENYNNETIFSEEAMDLHFVVKYVTKNKIKAVRIFEDQKCEKIFKNHQNKIMGYVPSRNRKINEKTKIQMIDKVDFDNLYFYFQDKFIKLSSDNKNNYNLIREYLKCTF